MLDFAKRCRLSKRLPLGSYGNDYTVVGQPHESMEENVVPESAFGRLSCNMQNQFSSTMSQFIVIIEPLSHALSMIHNFPYLHWLFASALLIILFNLFSFL